MVSGTAKARDAVVMRHGEPAMGHGVLGRHRGEVGRLHDEVGRLHAATRYREQGPEQGRVPAKKQTKKKRKCKYIYNQTRYVLFEQKPNQT